MDIENKIVELIKIEYADNNNLYIPVTSISLIQKYIGNVGLNTKLASLGSDRWIKIKQRAKKKIEDIAANLLLVQAKRELNKGFKYTFDVNSYEKFCKMFPYIETDDQLNCINDVISDMCSLRSMDRVICGDVGFGKTEVILRAAHIAVSNSKQVIILVPTTILAKQHYQTFKTRFSNYNINISLLTRVLSTVDKKGVLEDIDNGNTHIVIGTHALLNKNITYHNLGLLIIDEEHKFGVKHKEIIKTIKEEIDVLSLTATPIPRTLNAALSEIKDMSIINTAPVGRKNIETNIITKTKDDLHKYITREINRGGQILYIHNNIESMSDEINILKEINCNYRVEKVHGRLKNSDIENIMNRFINEEIDILVCTSIVESGLDMTNVNSIIINDAQNFGLSQLHQIRGRVGRSARQAYAGLILCDEKKMTKEAHRRIDAFVKTESLAGGLDIAGHDLDIRGAGEILGEEQSGQILEIGYGMYTSMLSRAINQLKNNEEIIKKQHVEVDAYISTLIPQEYIEDIFLRLEYYSEISNAQNEHELNQITSKLLDIYGPIPEYLDNLMNLTRVRIFANSINAERVKINRDSTIILLTKNSRIDHDQLINKYVLTGKIKLVDEYNLKYLNTKNHDFSDICNDIVSMIRFISSH
jgi:transcription-repair coupling factor (superfamily II helicase)